MKRKQMLVLLLSAAVSACSNESNEGSRPPATTASAAADSVASPAPVAAPDTAAAGHAMHGTPMPAHDGAGTQAAGHAAAGHAAREGDKAHAGQHAAAAPMRHDTAHAMAMPRHDMAQHRDTAKHDMAQHDMAQHRDTAKHDMAQHADTAKHDMALHADTAKHDMAQHADTTQHAAHAAHAAPDGDHADMQQMMSDMVMTRVGAFTIMGMAQIFPSFTMALPRAENTPLGNTGFYLTQPAAMINVSSPNERWVLRTTLNFEGITQPEGELTFGGWGEGFIDKRHPHTLLHEFMLSWNTGTAWRGASISAGKGFAPYGTDDPMSRPVLKYPTNHHLSQALERWNVSGVLALRSWGLEASVFGGQEPDGPYDLSNIESFGNSWSARVTKRYGTGVMGTWPWEVSASLASITETHHEESSTTKLYNVAVRHDHKRDGVPHYTLVEYSLSDAEDGDSYFSVLGESTARFGRHQPYARFEYATRPEYEREGPPSSDEFFRYDHDSHAIGSTRWLILTGGYGLVLGKGKVSPRPYIEAQYNRVRAKDGGIDPVALFGRSSFWSVSAGFRLFLGGEPMRMGTYGILDPMTAMHKMPTVH